MGRALVVLLVALAPVPALAHTKLVRSTPKAKDVLLQSPKLIELWFTEALEPGLTTIEVRDEQSNRVDKRSVALSEANKKAAIEVGELRAGIYTVVWKTVSADQHAIRGNFVFSVETSGAAATSNSPPQPPETVQTASPTHTISEEDQGEQISFAQIFVRWLSYLAMMMIFGGFAFRSFVLVPYLRHSHDGAIEADARTASERRALVPLWVSFLLLAVTSLAALAQQASAVFGQSLSPSLWVEVLKTGYGSSWILQITSVALIGVILFLLTRQIKRTPVEEHSKFWWLGLAASAALLVAPSWTGHAVASAEDFRLAVVTDWLHLVAGGFWVGALFNLALALVGKPQGATAVYHLIRRFTRVAIPSVLLLAMAGLYNAWAHVPSLNALWGTPYGKTLAVKLLLVVVMVLLGGVNNFYFGRRLARLSEVHKTNSDTKSLARLQQGFRTSVVFEAALGVVVLLVTAVLVFLTPARNHPAMNPSETTESVLLERR